jgi:hypothetical protein
MSTRAVRLGVAAIALGVIAGSAAAVSAAGGGGGGAARDGGSGSEGAIHEHLTGYEETPLALSTPGNGKFRARVTDAGITYSLSYGDIPTPVLQAHIHFGATGQTGGVSVFLCTNLGNGPAGTPLCPPGPATVTGMVAPTGVVAGAAAQGIAAGEYAELVDAINAGAAYVNVHSQAFPGGEIRAQIENGHEGHHH